MEVSAIDSDNHIHFPKEIASCDDSGGEEATRLHAKWSERRTHFFHSLAKHIVQQCVKQEVGRINVGELAGVREDENSESKNWGRHGNLDLHGWAFDRSSNILEYKAKLEDIEVVEVDERDTSKTCCVCGREDDSQRVERGLYVCEEHDDAFNADVNGAENIRLDMNQSNPSLRPIWTRIGVPAPVSWHSPESTFMSCPADSNRGNKW